MLNFVLLILLFCLIIIYIYTSYFNKLERYRFYHHVHDPFLCSLMSHVKDSKNIKKEEFYEEISKYYDEYDKKTTSENFTLMKKNTANRWLEFLIKKGFPKNNKEFLIDYCMIKILQKYAGGKLDKHLADRMKSEYYDFSPLDYKYYSIAISWAKGLLKDDFKYAYRPVPPTILNSPKLDNYSKYSFNKIIKKTNGKSIKIILLSDWAAGNPESITIFSKLVTYIGKNNINLVLHLGDVYYSGNYTEQYNYITKVMRKYAPSDVPIVNLAGNHDYYSGGQGYFKNLKNLNNFQKSSFLCLDDPKFRIICLDTGINDSNPLKTNLNTDITHLNNDQAKWANRMIETAKNKKIIVLSHHQLFDFQIGGIGQNKGINMKLYNTFKKNMHLINAWFWGHAHVSVIYKPNYANLAKGRLIGGCAVPVQSSTVIFEAAKNLDWIIEKDPPQVEEKAKYGKNSFVWNNIGCVMTIEPNGEIEVEYLELPIDDYGEFGKLNLLYKETI